MIYDDIFSVPIIQKAYKSYRICVFFRKQKCGKFPVRGKFRCKAIENTVCSVLKPLHLWIFPF